MRTEKEMIDIILNVAKNDERIRVVTMEGSKLNKNAPQDRFQDFDITYIVTDMESYKSHDDWLDIFGNRIIMQKPEAMALFPPTLGNWFTYLMTFADGNRIDLKLVPIHELETYFSWTDSLNKILLDKDNICPRIDEASDRDFHVKKPSYEFIDDCCNEFWHLSTYVTKGLCRNEYLYTIKHLELMKEQMLTMIAWKVGIETSFSLSVGKAYKYLDKYVSNDLWRLIQKSYKYDSIDSLWDSFIICCNIFNETALFVVRALQYKHPQYSGKVMKYIKQFIPSDKLGELVFTESPEAIQHSIGLKNNFDTEGRIIRWPKKREEKIFVLGYLQSKFEKGKIYKEKEINEILLRWHLFNDFAMLRREMYTNHLLNRTRDCREYWIEEE
jgi:aminoglycoside 6-adenylyltransferase